jgi:hypothetical protein
MYMSIIDQIALKIIRQQELIIGPIAWYEAGKVKGINIIDQKQGTLTIEDNGGDVVVDHLVEQYEHLFGRASREVCKEAVASIIADLSQSEIPSSLK